MGSPKTPTRGSAKSPKRGSPKSPKRSSPKGAKRSASPKLVLPTRVLRSQTKAASPQRPIRVATAGESSNAGPAPLPTKNASAKKESSKKAKRLPLNPYEKDPEHMEELQHALHLLDWEGTLAADADYIIMSFDLEKWFYEEAGRGHEPPKPITEIGVARIDSRKVKDFHETPRTFLEQMEVEHIKIKEYAHLINPTSVMKGTGKYVKSVNYQHHDDFDFGISEYINKKDVRSALEKMFNIPDGEDEEGNPQYRKIFYIGHDTQGDLDDLVKYFDYDIDKLNHIVRITDTQYLAWAHIPSIWGRKQRLDHILGYWKLENAPNLHNAGNDAAWQLITAVLMGISMAKWGLDNSKPHELEAVTDDKGFWRGVKRNPAGSTFFDLIVETSRRTGRSKGRFVAKFNGIEHFCRFCSVAGHSWTDCKEKKDSFCVNCLVLDDHPSNLCNATADATHAKDWDETRVGQYQSYLQELRERILRLTEIWEKAPKKDFLVNDAAIVPPRPIQKLAAQYLEAWKVNSFMEQRLRPDTYHKNPADFIRHSPRTLVKDVLLDSCKNPNALPGWFSFVDALNGVLDRLREQNYRDAKAHWQQNTQTVVTRRRSSGNITPPKTPSPTKSLHHVRGKSRVQKKSA
ncbi:hypothetical protein BT63DRAFT_410214 [Microthyrium microscopicum]|uniref:Gfd2/YDR514C-like C-terminal domain-containing protein n=1 Tax=Microthyrium microscopicum TaxID=703497 RepID=A0A6A6ULR3_9PEZI|nr:hypothetical protein BT63DRAFT_410214 [Microthyrium microscopicum]